MSWTKEVSYILKTGDFIMFGLIQNAAGLFHVIPAVDLIRLRNLAWGICFCLLFASISSSAEESSQPADPPDEKMHWFSLGIGTSSSHAPDAGSGAFRVGYSQRVWRGILTGRFICAWQDDKEGNISGIGTSKIRPLENTRDYGVLYGWFTKSAKFMVSLSGGLSVLEGVRHGELISHEMSFLHTETIYEKITYNAIAFPVEAQVYWTPLRQWGFGLCWFVDFNKEKRFSGVLVSVLLRY
ncbi:MAG: hypothetical protein V3V99_06425 [candidate division Zixibacteria bacterium]